MLITSLQISDYKRVRKVAITPASDRSIILIGGKNGAGKSSTLDALTAAFGGAKQVAADPVRHGAAEASIYVELDGGKLTIDRTIDADGKTTLEVRDAEGAVRQPQKVLDALIGARFLDPLAFLGLAPKEQRAQLMKLIPDAARIVDLDGKRERGFDRRTEIGRELTKAEGELARLPEVEIGKALDVAALTE
jgi:recombinational DNA repair ATPase RecF